MSGRIAHRPRYRNSHQYSYTSFNARQKFFTKHWKYRRKELAYERRALGSGLSLIHTPYLTLQSLVLHHLHL